MADQLARHNPAMAEPPDICHPRYQPKTCPHAAVCGGGGGRLTSRPLDSLRSPLVPAPGGGASESAGPAVSGCVPTAAARVCRGGSGRERTPDAPGRTPSAASRQKIRHAVLRRTQRGRDLGGALDVGATGAGGGVGQESGASGTVRPERHRTGAAACRKYTGRARECSWATSVKAGGPGVLSEWEGSCARLAERPSRHGARFLRTGVRIGQTADIIADCNQKYFVQGE